MNGLHITVGQGAGNPEVEVAEGGHLTLRIGEHTISVSRFDDDTLSFGFSPDDAHHVRWILPETSEGMIPVAWLRLRDQ